MQNVYISHTEYLLCHVVLFMICLSVYPTAHACFFVSWSLLWWPVMACNLKWLALVWLLVRIFWDVFLNRFFSSPFFLMERYYLWACWPCALNKWPAGVDVWIKKQDAFLGGFIVNVGCTIVLPQHCSCPNGWVNCVPCMWSLDGRTWTLLLTSHHSKDPFCIV